MYIYINSYIYIYVYTRIYSIICIYSIIYWILIQRKHVYDARSSQALVSQVSMCLAPQALLAIPDTAEPMGKAGFLPQGGAP